MSEIKNIPISKIETNKGQIEGLPKNPRFIKDYRFDALKKSISDAPDMLELREIAIKDNTPFGTDDIDILANEWDDGELVEWGMELPRWNTDNVETEGGRHHTRQRRQLQL